MLIPTPMLIVSMKNMTRYITTEHHTKVTKALLLAIYPFTHVEGHLPLDKEETRAVLGVTNSYVHRKVRSTG